MKIFLTLLTLILWMSTGSADSLRVVILGSSTAEGTGPLNPDNAWVNRYRNFLQSSNSSAHVINLARGGYTTYHIMPSSNTPPPNRPTPDSTRNISRALALNPSTVIINLPSNDAASGYSVSEQLVNYAGILSAASAQNVPVWITTTQPRNLPQFGRDNLMRMRDSTFARFQVIDFWYGLAQSDGKIEPVFDSGDGIHLNDFAHGILFERVQLAGVGLRKFAMQLLEPADHSEVSGSIQVTWSPEISPDSSSFTIVDLSRNNGLVWERIDTTAALDTSIIWETSNHPDGTRYKLRIITLSDSGIGIAQSAKSFTINNPGNARPELELLGPQKGDLLSGEYPVTWWSDDADGDPLDVSLEIQINSSEWQTIASNELNDGQFIWNTGLLPNSSLYDLKIRCTDGIEWAEQTAGIFSIQNITTSLPDTAIKQLAGKADGSILARLIQLEDVTSHNYQISFNDTSAGQKTYNVRDMDRDSLVVENASELDGQTEGPLFDGVRLLIADYIEPVPDDASSSWTIGNSTLTTEISNGSGTIQGVPYPADYEIRISEGIVDTSSDFLITGEIPVNFEIQNISDDRKVDFVFVEQDNNQSISNNDQIFILEQDDNEETELTWLIQFSSSDSIIPPEAGDRYFIKILKPFSNTDIFEFNSAVALKIQENQKKLPVNFQLRQNYPNPFNPITTIEYFLPRRTNVKIAIYNILGQKVAELVNGTVDAGFNHVIWSGRDDKGSMVGSGIYFYRMKAEDFMQVRRLLLLK